MSSEQSWLLSVSYIGVYARSKWCNNHVDVSLQAGVEVQIINNTYHGQPINAVSLPLMDGSWMERITETIPCGGFGRGVVC